MELADTVNTVGKCHSYKRPLFLLDSILTIVFTPFGLRDHKAFYIFVYIEGYPCWMLFQKCVVQTRLDIYVFIYCL